MGPKYTKPWLNSYLKWQFDHYGAIIRIHTMQWFSHTWINYINLQPNIARNYGTFRTCSYVSTEYFGLWVSSCITSEDLICIKGMFYQEWDDNADFGRALYPRAFFVFLNGCIVYTCSKLGLLTPYHIHRFRLDTSLLTCGYNVTSL